VKRYAIKQLMQLRRQWVVDIRKGARLLSSADRLSFGAIGCGGARHGGGLFDNTLEFVNDLRRDFVPE
jgi:hypothetical protein